MNGYLVLLHRTFDAVPLALFRTPKAARRFARSVKRGGQSDAPPRGPGELGRPGLKSRVLFVAVVRFIDGKPVAKGA